jgi:hypothetical protein
MNAPLPPLHHETHDRELLNMTAPLPPLPIPAIHERSPGGRNLFAYSEGQLHEFAKLAVREALERTRNAVKEAKENAFQQSADDAIRAMLKEYE